MFKTTRMAVGHYLHTIGDALSQLLNVVVFLSDTANESLSGRCYRQREHWMYGTLMKSINAVAALLGDLDHCEASYRNDVGRAHLLIGRTK